MDTKNKYLLEIFPIINQLYGNEDEKLVVKKFCSRSLRFLYELEDKYEPVKIKMQKEDFCKEKGYFSFLRRCKKGYPNDYRKIMARLLKNIVFRIVIKEILDCDVYHNPALSDLYLDFRDGIDLSYKEDDVLDAIESKKSREELKKTLRKLQKFTKIKSKNLKFILKG